MTASATPENYTTLTELTVARGGWQGSPRCPPIEPKPRYGGGRWRGARSNGRHTAVQNDFGSHPPQHASLATSGHIRGHVRGTGRGSLPEVSPLIVDQGFQLLPRLSGQVGPVAEHPPSRTPANHVEQLPFAE